jgi:hypothetical protein
MGTPLERMRGLSLPARREPLPVETALLPPRPDGPNENSDLTHHVVL